MKEIMKELVRLAVLTVIVMVAFFAFMVLVAIMIEGAEFLPKYIGGFGTFMLYVAGFMVMFAGIKYFADRNERLRISDEWVHLPGKVALCRSALLHGDTFRVAEVITDASAEDVLELMRVFFNYNVPTKDKWNPDDCYEYFAGYCTVEPITGGYKYTKCEPYTD